MRKTLASILLVGTSLVGGFGFYSCNQEKGKVGEIIETEKSYLKNEIDSLNKMGWDLKEEDYNKSFELLEESLGKAKEINYEQGITDAYIRRGNIYRRQGKYELSKKNYFKYLEIKEQVGDILGVGKAFNNLAIVFDEQGKYDEAVKYYVDALKIYEKLSDSIRMSRTYNNLGTFFDKQGKTEKALEYFNKSLEIKENLNDSIGISVTLNNIGTILEEQGKYEKAFEHYFKSLSLARETENQNQEASCYNNLANLHKKKGDLDKAFDYFSQSKKLNQEIGNKKNLARNLMNIGRIYKEKENFPKALENSEKALSIAKKINNLELLVSIFESLSEVYKAKGDFIEALNYHEFYSEMKDSLLNEKSSKQIAEAETKYETEKKEKENELLRNKEELQLTKNKQQRTLNYSLGGLAALLLGFGAWAFRAYKNKKKAKEIIEKKNKEITESIEYASNIQKVILPRDEDVEKILGEDSFVFYKPKAIVSGDFYWMIEKNKKVLFAACDCTGHGVPGAFMHMNINGFLNEAVNEKQLEKPNKIFDYVRKKVVNSLKSTGETGGQKDGMDSVLCSLDKKHNTLEFACANNPLYRIRNNELEKFKGDKMCVGYGDKSKPFKDNKIDLQKNDLIYILSDGYQDQFGGLRGKKFGPKQLRELLLSISEKPMGEQKEILGKTFSDWKRDEEQVDDILIMGVRV